MTSPEPFRPEEVLAHTIEEGGEWRKGYVPNWSTAVLRNGCVFDRVCERRLGKLERTPFDAKELAHIDDVINGRWQPSAECIEYNSRSFAP